MPRTETVNLQARVPAQLKRDADMLFRSMGLETGDAVRVFFDSGGRASCHVLRNGRAQGH